MDKPLDGVQAKYDRAKEQFDQLNAELDAFFNADPEPHFSSGAFDLDAWEWVERFQVRKKPPLRFGVILGDCVHNLRSALDHLIWQVTLLDGGTPDDNTQFPIVKESAAKFDRQVRRRIPGLSPKHRALVKQAQPYNAGDRAHLHPLAVLNELSRVDKHRIVNPTYSFLASDAKASLDQLVKNYKGTEPSPIIGFMLAKEGVRMEHGTPWFRVKFPKDAEAPTAMNVSGNVPLDIAFGEFGMSASAMPEIAEAVMHIIQVFASDFPEP